MEYVVVEWRDQGLWHDPQPYLDALDDLAPTLPPGARTWATHPQHYNLYSDECPKGLRIREVSWYVDEDGPACSVVLAHGSSRRTVRYAGVREWLCGFDFPAYNAELEVLLDEVLPHHEGCSHEIMTVAGSLRVVCADLDVTWEPQQLQGG